MKPRVLKGLGALLALCMVAGAAQANTTGNELFAWLNGTSYEKVKGAYYLDGIVDGITIAGVASRKPVVCMPSGVNLGQISDVVAKGLRNNPEDRHLAASILVFLSLKETWPCEASK